MDKKLKKFLYDINLSIQSIKEYIKDISTLEQYQSNKMMKRAVEREFEIIGEAINNMLKLDSNIPITNVRRIIDFRNYLIHGYSDISDKVVWSIIDNNLSILEKEVIILLKK